MSGDRTDVVRGGTEVVGGARLAGYPVVVISLVLLVLVIDGIDIQLLSLVAPVILDEWSLQRADFGIALAAALFGMSIGAAVGGWLGDRYGRLNVLVGSIVLFGVATAAAGTSENVTAMTVLRVISGLGFGAASPNGVALASDWVPLNRRAQITGLMSVGTPAGGMIGASLVLALLPVTGWRGTFYACGVLTLVLAVVVAILIKEAPRYLMARGQVERARSIARRHLGTDLTPLEPGASDAGQGRTKPVGYLTRANLRLNLGVGWGFFALAAVSYAYIAWTPVVLTSAGVPLDSALRAIFAFNLAAVAAALASGFLSAQYGTRTVMAVSSIALACVVMGLGVFLEAGVAQYDGLTIVALTGAAGGFAGAGLASVYAIMAVGYPVESRAGGMGFGMMLGRAGGILAAYAGGFVLDLGEATVWPYFIVLTAFSVLGGICAFVADRHVPPRRAANGG